jgi:peptidoglycan hydrolase-like protein with peptidoglycan-binding domain
MPNFADKLRAKGVTVKEVPGWETHARPYTFDPSGVMVHHTAGSNSLKVVRNGRKGLPGPLAQFLISKSGVVYLISQGYSNHAGKGNSSVLKRTRAGLAPKGKATSRGDINGNRHYWGIEVENLGNGKDPYPDVQIQALTALTAALCEINDWSSNRIVHHKEWTSRKIDMSYRGDVRGITADIMSGKIPRNYSVDCSNGIFQLKDRGDCVNEIQKHLIRHGATITADGNFGPNTKGAVEAFQEKNSLTVDGIVGGQSWAKLKEAVYAPAAKNEQSRPTLKVGVTHKSVVSLRVWLDHLGYSVSTKESYFNGWLDTKVKEFQKSEGLVSDGIVGKNTWAALDAAMARQAFNCEDTVFKIKDSGDCVKKIQKSLKDKGFDVSVDGEFGVNTESAVKHFQLVFRISSDGTVGPETWKTLEASYGAQSAVIYKSNFDKALAMLLGKKHGIRVQSYLDNTVVKNGVLVGTASAYAQNYTTHRTVTGSNVTNLVDNVFDELTK